MTKQTPHEFPSNIEVYEACENDDTDDEVYAQNTRKVMDGIQGGQNIPTPCDWLFHGITIWL